jgi:hypothetical protein
MSVVRRLLACCLAALALPALVHAASTPVVAAAKKTATAKSSTFQMSVVTTVGAQRTTLTGSGVQRGTEVRMSMRVGGQAGAFRIDAILVEEKGHYVMYMRSPIYQAQLPPGKSWIRVDLSKQGAGVGADFSSLVSVSQTFAPLEKGLVSTTEVGRELVAGRSATHYRAVLDVRRAAAAVPAFGRQVRAIERAAGVRLGRLPYDVWIADDGRIRRLRYPTPTARGGKSVQTLTFLTFDRPVTITAPPRSQVVSV